MSNNGTRQVTRLDIKEISIRKFALILMLAPVLASAQDDIYRRAVEMVQERKDGEATKTLVREHTYDAGASDSKISARKKALKEIKRRALSEIGVHVRSYLNLKTTKTPDGVERMLDQRVRNVTAGTVQTKILEERWTGGEYYVKARLTVNAESVAEGITAALQAEASKEEAARLEEIVERKEKALATKSDRLKELEKKAANRAMRLQAKEDRVSELRAQVERLQKRLAAQKAEERRAQSKLEKIRARIERATDKAWKLVERRMTPEEVVELAGKPRSPDVSLVYPPDSPSGRVPSMNVEDGTAWNYGRTWVHWKNGIVRCVSKKSSDQPTPCDVSKANNRFSEHATDEYAPKQGGNTKP
jgi:hypothetical protein